MRIHDLFALLIALASPANALAQPKPFPIWPGEPPGYEDRAGKESRFVDPRTKEAYLRNVLTPTLTAYPPDPAKATGTAVIVIPGGGFTFLRWENATEIAELLASRGFAAFVLKHRLIDTGASEDSFKASMEKHAKQMIAVAEDANAGRPLHSLDRELLVGMLRGTEDARQSIRCLRRDAKKWGIKPDRIAVLGLSSGGITALAAAIEHDAESRPDLVAPIYTPWFLEKADAALTFLGAKPPADAPPAFIAVTSDDFIAVPGSLLSYNLWRSAGLSAELHIYAEGNHGFGARPQGLPVDGWLDRYVEWLNTQGRKPK